MAQATAVRLVDFSGATLGATCRKELRSSNTHPRTSCFASARTNYAHGSAQRCNKRFEGQLKTPGIIALGRRHAKSSAKAPQRCCSREPSESNSQGIERRAPVRRTALLLAGAALVSSLSAVVADQGTAHAAPSTPPPVEEVPEIVKVLLERSRLNKAKYDKERLDDYNRRNFSDYFEFSTGSKNPKKMTETDKAMLKWLEANKKK